MKLKYIFSVVAGLVVMTAVSCSEKTSTEAGAEESATTATVETATTNSTEEGVESASSYYVMFSGKGWGVGKRASSALKNVDGVESVVLSGLRATVKMNAGTSLDEKTVQEVLTKKNLTFVSQSAVTDAAPKVVYVLNVAGVGWSDTEEKARVALNDMDKVTNVYLGSSTEVWMSEDAPLDKDAVAVMLDGLGLSLEGMEKTDKSAL
jgi:hypothetical protein